MYVWAKSAIDHSWVSPVTGCLSLVQDPYWKRWSDCTNSTTALIWLAVCSIQGRDMQRTVQPVIMGPAGRVCEWIRSSAYGWTRLNVSLHR